MTHIFDTVILRSITLLLATALSAHAAKTTIPDFTQGEELVASHAKKKFRERTLGPTGLWASHYSQSMFDGASRDTRQFLITRVETGSPAEGRIKVGDVLIGVAGKAFDADARKLLAAAIQRAEETDGKLTLEVWRPTTPGAGEGRTGTVILPLQVLGRYDPTTPYNNPYTEAVIDQLVAHAMTLPLPPKTRAKDQSNLSFPSLSALGMLASGREELMPMVKDYAHYACIDPRTKERITFEVSDVGKRVWRTAYKLIFLSEYYLATGDEFVLPTIELLAVGTAKGQSGAGTYGHRFSSRTDDGGYHGPLLGYGAINNAAISMMTGILLARECGVEHPEITQAIARGKRFFDFFVEHGGISYGDHWAGYDYVDNNGTTGLIAVMYDLMNDDRGQRYFGAMSVAASATGREEGHQGCYWTHLWGEVGSARAGSQALRAATEESRFLRTLERGWQGQIIDQGNIGPTKYGSRGDVTGSRLLLYGLGDKRLMLTGKHLEVNRPLQGKELQSTLRGGHLLYHPEGRKQLSEAEIFSLLAHELPAVRLLAAKALREQGLHRVDQLIALIDSDSRYARYGACTALGQAGYNSSEAVAAIMQRLESDEDILFRFFAVDALSSGKGNDTGLHGAAAPAVPLLLKLAGQPVPHDPRGHLHWQISEALFYYKKDLFRSYVKDHAVDDALLVPAVRQFLANENGRARSAVPFDLLTDAQLEPLWGSILTAVGERAPSGIMFSDAVRTKGLTLLAEHRIEEGLELAKQLAEHERTDSTMWVPWFAETMFKVLPEYGTHAAPIIEVIEQWQVLEKRGAELAKQLPTLKKQIEAAGEVPLRHIHQ